MSNSFLNCHINPFNNYSLNKWADYGKIIIFCSEERFEPTWTERPPSEEEVIPPKVT